MSAAGRVVEVLRRDGTRVVTARILAALADRLLAGQPAPLAVRRADLLAAPAAPVRAALARPQPGGAGGAAARSTWTLNFVANPLDEQSGGMSTLMRTITLLEGRGHDCRIYVMFKGARRDLERQRRVLGQRFPAVRAAVDDLDDGMRDADGIFATAWPTAYAVRASSSGGARLYLVQDFEPMFYAMGSDAVLAEQTYRFGFHGITAGRWLAEKLAREFDMACDAFDLGVDLSCYRIDERADGADASARDGVVFYARPDTPRRGFELGMLALELFHRSRPHVPIHLVGQDLTLRRPPFPLELHGHCAPGELSQLYNRCRAGLVLSLTNISLLPTELLATGCIPVMNDGENTRASFDNPFVRFAPPTPEGLAEALRQVVDAPDAPARRAAAAASVEARSWERVADQLECGVRRGLAAASARAGAAEGVATPATAVPSVR